MKAQLPLVLPWKDAATFKKVATALNLPSTYVSALNHSSGHVELLRMIGTGGTNECIGMSS